MNPGKKAQYRRIESHPVAPRPSSLARPRPSSPAPATVPPPPKYTTPPPRYGLNLQRYIYGGGIVTPAKRPFKDKPRKPKGPTRVEKIRQKSTFLKAATRAERQRAQIQDGLEAEAQTSALVPDPGSGAADDGDDDDVFMTRVLPGFLANYGRDMLMD